ncbi:MAG: hypothetical protein AAFN41_10005 [Planctomycetota bacterium]
MAGGIAIVILASDIDYVEDANVDVGNPPVPRTDDGPTIVFYRGTSYYDAAEIVAQQGFGPEQIARQDRLQELYPSALGEKGFFLTTQLWNAAHWAGQAGQGRGGGPAVLRAEVPAEEFSALAASFGIQVERPMVQAPQPGATETLLPFLATPPFNTMASFSLIEPK